MTTAAPTKPGPNGKRASEMNAEYQEWADRQPAKSSCARPGCRWKFSGTAGEAREAAAAHRAAEHPELRPRTVQQITTAKKREEKEQMAEARREAAARPRREPAPAPVPEEARGRKKKWTKEKALDGVREIAAELGHPPTANHAKTDSRIPSGPTVAKLFGTHADMIEQAGFERPSRATRYGRRSLSAVAEPTPDEPAEVAPEAPEQPVEEALPGESAPPPDELVAFLYLLLRDRLPAGHIEQAVADVEQLKGKRPVFSNLGLEEYARDVAGRLLRSAA